MYTTKAHGVTTQYCDVPQAVFKCEQDKEVGATHGEDIPRAIRFTQEYPQSYSLIFKLIIESVPSST